MKNGMSSTGPRSTRVRTNPLFQADEEIAVLGAGGNALEVEQAAQLVGRQKVSSSGRAQG
jgi:DNA-directed RNA polymerase beta' subunit